MFFGFVSTVTVLATLKSVALTLLPLKIGKDVDRQQHLRRAKRHLSAQTGRLCVGAHLSIKLSTQSTAVQNSASVPGNGG